MIDQTKEKKDDVLKSKKAETKKEDPSKALKQAQEQKLDTGEKTEPTKADAKDKGANNSAKAIQSLGSAKITAEKADVYSEPAMAGGKIASLQKAQKVDILGQKDGHLKVMVDGKLGYIKSDKTDFEGKTGAKTGKKEIGSAQITAAALNVRKGPSEGHDVLGVLRENDRIKIYGEKNGFLELRIGDEIGYISSEYTDYGAKQKVKPKGKKDSDAFEKAPAELQELLAKESLTAGEITQARALIEQSQESMRGDLFEALQTKPAYLRAQKNKPKNDKDLSGGGLEHLATALQMLGVRNPNSEMPYESYLEQVKRDLKLPSKGSMETWGSIANAMGVSYSSLCEAGNRQGLEKNFWTTIVREQLRQGKAIMACIQQHTVRIEGIDEKGLIITVPDSDGQGFTGLGQGWQAHQGQGSQKSAGKRGILAFDALQQATLQWVVSMG